MTDEIDWSGKIAYFAVSSLGMILLLANNDKLTSFVSDRVSNGNNYFKMVLAGLVANFLLVSVSCLIVYILKWGNKEK